MILKKLDSLILLISVLAVFNLPSIISRDSASLSINLCFKTFSLGGKIATKLEGIFKSWNCWAPFISIIRYNILLSFAPSSNYFLDSP